MNTTDEALLLFRRLRGTRLAYRAYLRWKRRDARLPGTIRPSSVIARSDWGCSARRELREAN